MNANLTVYAWAEQTNRQQLSARAERGWLAEEAAARRPRGSYGATLRWAMGALLIRIGTRLHGLDPVPSGPTPAESLVRA